MIEITEMKNIFNKYVSKKNSEIIAKGILNFSKQYATINDTEFLLQGIINTKIDEIDFLLSKDDFLKTEIKNKNINPYMLCEYPPEILNPDKYKDIINKKKMEEYRKNNKATSDAFTCPKCKATKSEVTQKQVRSGDEPATIFIKCVECGFSYSI